MVLAIRNGDSVRAVARRFHVGPTTVQRWVDRARGGRLDRVDWRDRPDSPHRTERTAGSVEDLVLVVRHELKTVSDLGEFGAIAIQRELRTRGLVEIPSIRTIGRILERRGALDGRTRLRRTPPPVGWYLPEVAQGRVELDAWDVVQGLVIEGGTDVEVLNVMSLHGGLAGSWPLESVTARASARCLVEHWREVGLPVYAQFDNDTRFQGPHQYRDTVGRVARLCLSLGVTPVFAPPRETGFQAAIEGYNGRWQAKVWERFHHESLRALQEQSARYVQAYRQRRAPRTEAAPGRNPFPTRWTMDLQAPLRGQIIYLRRTDQKGRAELLGHRFDVHSRWPNRLVRSVVDLSTGRIEFYGLRRREPALQPLLKEIVHRLPRRRFIE